MIETNERLGAARLPVHRQMPSVSVVICSHDRLQYVQSCMASLAQQTVGRDGFEIVLVDSGSPAPVAAEMKRIADETSNTRLVRLDVPGISLARNEGARAALGDYVAYIDDDVKPMPDWIEQIQHVIAERDRSPAVLGGKVLPLWESPLPIWWPLSLRGVLSIIEHDGAGEYRTDALPAELEPYGVNMVLHRDVMLQHGGFSEALGRQGLMLLSDEDVQLAWRLQDAGFSTIYDSRVAVHHSIQAKRLSPEWLLSRLYWQGASTVRTRLMLGQGALVRKELLRRVIVAAITLPFAWIIPTRTPWLMALRWRHAYASGFAKEAFSWGLGKAAVLLRLRKLGTC